MNTLLVRAIWTISFASGGFNHARDIYVNGWLPYDYVPLPINVFWTALLLLDFLAAILIWTKPQVGASLGLAIMLSDVAINSWTVFIAEYSALTHSLALQFIFLIFVCLTFRQIFRAKPAPLRSI